MGSYETQKEGTVVVSKPIVVVIPKVPNFIAIDPGDGRSPSSVKPVDVSEFTPEQRLIGQQWTEKTDRPRNKAQSGSPR